MFSIPCRIINAVLILVLFCTLAYAKVDLRSLVNSPDFDECLFIPLKDVKENGVDSLMLHILNRVQEADKMKIGSNDYTVAMTTSWININVIIFCLNDLKHNGTSKRNPKFPKVPIDEAITSMTELKNMVEFEVFFWDNKEADRMDKIVNDKIRNIYSKP